ncbi:restriction endonuclease subunit S [Pseudanabaena sp. UWO311]|uniref:restriction endonuclease subunit S n=1 Tax=Pseudanabaena sp. UWO311 TaxID=2487337 RepID=UPI001158CF99|nr:restriction endonuclease subunit S [Pseudanabaena sp. UWO311]TYQ29369.1 restriction endonuclease subunit S [Pseudanabaena sp. UWO311]
MKDKLHIGIACNITTGKLDSNHAIEGGEYPFFTCAAEPIHIDHYSFDGDVVLVAGNNAQGNFHINRFKGKFNAYQRTYVLTAKENFDIDYIYYSLRLELKRLKEKAQGSQTKFLTMPILEGIALREINSNIQKKIADVLSALDAKIELNNRINAELESLAKTIYDYWFVQFDFPNADGKPYKSSGGEMVYVDGGGCDRAIPAGWEIGCVSDLFEINPSETLSKGNISAYIDMSAIPTSGFMTGEIQYKPFNGGMKFRNGDVVIARITPCLENGKTGLITLLKDNEIGFGSTEFIVLRGKNRSLSSFAACLSRSTSFRNFAISNMTGTSGRKRVDAKAIERFSIPIPENGLISQFENVVSRYFQLLTINTRENQQLTKLRDWLLPMLMNGQVSIK